MGRPGFRLAIGQDHVSRIVLVRYRAMARHDSAVPRIRRRLTLGPDPLGSFDVGHITPHLVTP